MRLAALVVVVLAAGCAQPRERIPTYPSLDEQESLQVIRQRAAMIRSVSGEGTVTLIDQKGDSVRFDAAFVLAPPDRARVRAWKFGQAVIDLCVIPDGVWLFLPRRDGHEQQLKIASQETSRAMRQWLAVISRGVDESSDASTVMSPSRIVVTRASNDERMVCTIDRPTLTPRRYELFDSSSRPRFALVLSQYKSTGTTVWPTRAEATSDSGRIIVQMRDVEVNSAIADDAFKPPARAERLP